MRNTTCIALRAKKASGEERAAALKRKKKEGKEEEKNEKEEEEAAGLRVSPAHVGAYIDRRESARYWRIHYTQTLASNRIAYSHAEYRRPGRCTHYRLLSLLPLSNVLPLSLTRMAASFITSATSVAHLLHAIRPPMLRCRRGSYERLQPQLFFFLGIYPHAALT